MRIWTTIGAAVAVSGLIGMAACGSKSSSGGGSGSGCSGLATCCSSLPAADDPSGCTTVANAGDENACDQTITGLHASNNCTGVSAGSAATGATCAQLLSCCTNGTFSSASLKTDCTTVANAGNEGLCASDYPNYVTLNICPSLDAGVAPSKDAGSGVVTPSACGSLNECCSSSFFPADGGMECIAIVNANNASACQTALTQYETDQYCLQ